MGRNLRLLLIASAILLVRGDLVMAQKVISPSPAAPSSPTTLQPLPSPTQEQQRPASDDKRGSAEVPLPVRIVPSPDRKAEADDEKRRADEHAAAEHSLTDATWKLAWFTLGLAFIAFVQAALFVTQLWLIRLSLKDAKTTAEAAKAAADLGRDEFNASHRPRIRVREVAIATDGFDAPLSFGLGKTISTRFAITNVGDSEAKITDVYAKIFRTNLPLPMRSPPMNSILKREINIKPAFIVGLEEFADDEPLTEDFLAGSLYVMGTIIYTDIDDQFNQRARRIFFCRRFVANPPSFERIDNQDYENEF